MLGVSRLHTESNTSTISQLIVGGAGEPCSLLMCDSKSCMATHLHTHLDSQLHSAAYNLFENSGDFPMCKVASVNCVKDLMDLH